MNFSAVHEGLEPGKYFDTVWVALPAQTHQYLIQTLAPIKQFCLWVAAVEMDVDSKTIPHITLRYLGYDTDNLRNLINYKIPEFKQVIQPQNQH